MLNIVRLRVLRELYHRKTLSAVAEALSYSTSAVSQQVRLLEKEVGVPLVEPAGRRLQLTPQGLILVAHAEQILDLLERAEADVSTSMEQPRGTVRIAAFQSAALTIVPQALKELRRLHPQLTIEFEQGEPETTLPALASSEYDLVIAESYPGIPVPSTPGVTTTRILEDPLWLTMDAGLAETLDPHKDMISQLSDAKWAVETAESAPRTWVTNECRKAGFDPQVVCSSEDVLVHLRFVEAGLAVAVLPGLALAGAAPNVRRYPTAPGMQSRTILLAGREASMKRPSIIAVSTALQHAAAAYGSGTT
ncbi:LysR family transcriptional regulator [Arthrobacter sp. Soil736]|uniref:LysR substrate-binding domain-containing protein n=1 Tax=Arthrobacter sp. Soil736 TaxID=1736395 RepID=UPI0006FE5E23|nr:LysR substrate-binding domain-containing protein [Arthrobacter sp. Soil736]KRE54097.1 LysR family transcriptional regulator [Arthrobacter sp. Soil736]